MKLFILFIALMSVTYAFPSASAPASVEEEKAEIQEPAESAYHGGWSHGSSHGLSHGWDGLYRYGDLHGYSTYHGNSGWHSSPRIVYHSQSIPTHNYHAYSTPHYYGGWSRGWW